MTKGKSPSGISLPFSKRARPWVVYVALFLAIFGLLDYGYYLTRGTMVERLLIDSLTVRPAASLINLLFPSLSAHASGHSLISSFGQINVLQGCEGTEGMFLLIAAVIPFPTGRLRRLLGIAGGVLLMYALNQLRLLALVVSLEGHRGWFASLHGLIAPTFIVVGGCLFFFAWAHAATTPSRA